MTEPSSRVELHEASAADAPALERLLQLYQYDFSEIDGGVIDGTGLYRYVTLRGYWAEPDHHAFFVRVNDELAGCVLVKPGSLSDDDAHGWLVDEFFVMRKFRRRGVGREVARRIFDRFPGRWELWETARNAGAQTFWRTVLAEYTGGRFKEAIVHGRPTQTFESGPH